MATKNSAKARGKTESKAKEPASPGPRDSVRETVESIVIAFVLAFLFRTFEAEAFVIPTGSMAPTLMGRHKDLNCSNCGYSYRVSASDEEPRDGGSWRDIVEQEADNRHLTGGDREQFISRETSRVETQHRVTASICPVCRYEMDFGPGEREASVRHGSYKGDRILVAKFPYEFADPKRWDVAVFKNPGKAKENYIKRVVGIPNETVVIWHGNIHTTQEDMGFGPHNASTIAAMQQDNLLQIARKPPAKVEAMLQVVHDNDYLPKGVPLRWEPQSPGWETIADGRGFEYDGTSADDAMLVYNHLLPTPAIWQQLQDNPRLSLTADEMPAQLITDFYAYNTNAAASMGSEDDIFGNHWVGDLAIDCRLKVQGNEGEAILQLVEGGVVFECRIDVASGKASFHVPGDSTAKREAQTAVRGPGTHRLRFANVDDQLLLWVDGKQVAFDGNYGPLGNIVPSEEDRMPARLGTKGLAARFDELRLLRDIYYIATRGSYADVRRSPDFFKDASQWNDLLNEPAIAFNLSADRFLVLGDNSPRSADSRMWSGRDEQGATEYYVKRELLVGKAVYIYWPHALDHLPYFNIWFPFFPNFARMGFVR
jgi:signal peptidase I